MTISSEFFGECRQILLAGRSGQAGMCFLVGLEGKSMDGGESF